LLPAIAAMRALSDVPDDLSAWRAPAVTLMN
jgi:hypothetical protein